MKNIVKGVISTLFAGLAGFGCWYFLTHTTWFAEQFGFLPSIVHLAVSSGIVGLLTFWLFHNVCLAPGSASDKEPKAEAKAETAVTTPVQKTAPNPTQKQMPHSGTKADAAAKVSEKKEQKEIIIPNETKISFRDIAGYEQTKKSMQFLVSCLTDQERLQEIGARVPTGILFYGPPGTGKTLFGRAIAGEAKVPFFYVSGSNFVEKYVGIGAQRVRALFKSAKEHQPCVLFIDEIDAVGTRREDGTNEERQQTLNQLLVEINNLSANHVQVMLIAATNQINSLDPALLRPGRFDRKIAVPLPNTADRLEILKLHCSEKKLDTHVDLKKLAMMTENMSGADLASLINEAAIQAVYQKHKAIMQEDIDTALFQILTGGEKSEVTDINDLRVIAYHEAGHALATKLLTDDEVPQVSIIGSTSGALGLTMRYSSKDVNLISKKQMETKLKVFYAGRAAEECYFGNSEDITTGASDDLKRASLLIRDYLTTYGMGTDSVLNVAAFSGKPDEAVTAEAKALAHRIYQDTILFLQEHRELLDAVAEALLQYKILDAEKLDEILSRKE